MSNQTRSALVLFAALTAASSMTAQGNVITAGTAAGDTVTLQDAINIAADGDHIVLLESRFETVFIVGKSLTISGIDDTIEIGSFPPFTPTSPTLAISNLGVDQTVVIRRLMMDARIEDPIPCVNITNCLGNVHFEDCTIQGFNGAAASINGASAVTFTSSQVIGGFAFDSIDDGVAYAPQPGIVMSDSNVSLYDSSVAGSSGPDAFQLVFQEPTPPAPGGPGLVIGGNSVLTASGSTVNGGAGGNAGEGASLCFDARDGGTGLVVNGTAASVRLRNTGGGGGAGGTVPASCSGTPGDDGIAIDAPPGTIVSLGDITRSLTTTSFVTEGNDVALSFTGVEGDAVSLLLSGGFGPSLYFPASELTLHLGLPLIVIPLGTLPASGTLDLSITVPTLPPGFDALTVPMQAFFLDASMDRFTSGPSAAVVYSAAGAP